MLKKYSIIALILLNLSAIAQKQYKYPSATKDSISNKYFDQTIEDPYQWMEDPTDPKLATWLEDQNKITIKQKHAQTRIWTFRQQMSLMYLGEDGEEMKGYVERDEKDKSKFQFINKYTNYSRTPDLLYRVRGSGENYKSLVKMKDFRTHKEENIIITSKNVNEDLDMVAIEMSRDGGDWREIHFYSLVNGEKLNGSLKYLRSNSNLIWFGKGVYYDRFDVPESGRELLDKVTGQTLYYHKIGANQEEDKLVYQNPDVNGTNLFKYSTIDEKKLFFYHFYYAKGKTYKALSYAVPQKDNSIFLKNFLIYPNSDTINFSIEELKGDTVLLKTNWNAPNGKVLGANINELNKPFEIIPEYDINLRRVDRLGKDKFVCVYRQDGKFLVLIYDFSGKLLKKIDYPEGKKVNYFYERDEDVKYTEFCISSFYHPDLWYQISLTDLTIKPIIKISVPFKPQDLETRYVKYTAKDGTKIPMYITCLKKTKLNGKNPTLIYGYGGYGVTIEPSYNEFKALWLLHGGILAVPNVRGGGGEGSHWSKSGRGLNKQNCIDDFISAAEYLIKENYTNPKVLGVNGGSHGGMLVGAAITQRPELFNAAVIEAGVLDMLRFENFTIGSVNVNLNEYGTVKNKESFHNLLSYSPLHKIKKGVKYPNTLIITGDKDDRVPPFHSYKFLASLQEKGDPKSIYQLYLVKGAGHQGSVTPTDNYNKVLYKYYFLFDKLGLNF